MDLFQRKAKSATDSNEVKAWEQAQDWSNPFQEEEEDRPRVRKESKKKKKKRRHRRHKMTEEEYSEMSSKADSLLDDLLNGDDVAAPKMPQVHEVDETEYLKEDNSVKRKQGGKGVNPFDDDEEEEEVTGNEIDQQGYVALLHGTPSPSSTNPFGEEPGQNQGQEADDEASGALDDDSTLEPPPSEHEREQYNPAENPSTDKPANDAKDQGELTDRTASNSFDTGEEQEIEATLTSSGMVETQCVDVKTLQRAPTETTDPHDDSDSSSEEDVVESSRRLLQMAGQRMQYQQYNDEIRKLREQVDSMKKQAEAMSEQLRRAVETKCDLVLSQTEMERCHEQNLIAKDDELYDMRMYIRELMDNQAKNELSFMNEIAVLSKKMQDMDTKHKSELARKDLLITQLEAQANGTQTEQSESEMSHAAFRNMFIDYTSGFSKGATISAV